jgi:hypothetical protein
VKPLKSSSFATLLALDAQSRTAVEEVVRAEKAGREATGMDADSLNVRLQLRDRRLVLDEKEEHET